MRGPYHERVKTGTDDTNVTLRLGRQIPIDFVCFDVSPAGALAIEVKFDF